MRLARDKWKTAHAGIRGVQHLFVHAIRAALTAAGRAGDAPARDALRARAFGYAERGRARALLDLMASSAAVARAPVHEAAQQRRWRQLSAEVMLARQLVAAERGSPIADGDRIAAFELRADECERELRRLEADLAREWPRWLEAVSPTTRVMTLDQVATALGPDQALIQHVFLEDDLLGWAITREGMVHHRVDRRDASSLAHAIRRLHASCESGAADWEHHAAEVADALLSPFSDVLATCGRLVYVPFGPAHELPLAVLPWRGRMLAETHAVSVLPSASAIQFLGGAPEQAEAVLAVGNPSNMAYRRPGASAPEPWQPLPAAGTEAEGVAAQYPRGRSLIGPQATEPTVRRLVSDYPVLHFATHGHLAQEPLLSCLLLAEGEELTVLELMGIGLDADLVVLSACRTARGEAIGGDEVLGLTRALLAAGARGAVVSLWPVDDASTALLMTGFHRRLRSGRRPPQALREASAELRRLDEQGEDASMTELRAGASQVARDMLLEHPSRRVGLGHPRHWAPFVVVGL